MWFIDCSYMHVHTTFPCSWAIDVERRASMDRCRLEDAHLKFAVLQVISWYPDLLHLKEVPMTSSVNEMLKTFTSSYYTLFTAKYAGMKH